MIKSPIVSVVMITYNQEKYIAAAIEGVLMQRCDFEVELIIADDNSPDSTKEVVESFKNHPKYHWIKYFKHEVNKGMMGNFIWALDQCKGKYVALCEGDDYWTDPLKLQKQVDFLEGNADYSFTFHDAEILNQDTGYKRLRIGDRKIDNVVDLRSVIIENNIPTASILFRNILNFRDLPDWFFKTSKGDYALVIMFAEMGFGKYLPEAMSVYRVHDGGVWSGIKDRSYHIKENIKFYNFLLEYFHDEDVRLSLKIKLKRTFQDLGLHLIRNGDVGSGLIMIFKNRNFSKANTMNLSIKKIVKESIKVFLKKI